VERVRDVLLAVAGVSTTGEGACSIEAAPEIEPVDEELVTV
jgi:hypothetical protein